MGIIRQEELMEATGYERRADLERCLRDQGITLFYGKGGKIWTTSEILAQVADGGRIDAPIQIDQE